MKYCRICDKSHPDNLMFCPVCGSFLTGVKEESSDNEASIKKKRTKKSSNRKCVNPGVYKLINQRTGKFLLLIQLI